MYECTHIHTYRCSCYITKSLTHLLFSYSILSLILSLQLCFVVLKINCFCITERHQTFVPRAATSPYRVTDSLWHSWEIWKYSIILFICINALSLTKTTTPKIDQGINELLAHYRDLGFMSIDRTKYKKLTDYFFIHNLRYA